MSSQSRILVTGASGFVGRALIADLQERGYEPVAGVRVLQRGWVEQRLIDDISSADSWKRALQDIDVVLHLAGQAHDRRATQEVYHTTNVIGTSRLAEVAVGTGVRRLVFLSSVKVNGEDSGDSKFTAEMEPQPCDAYGWSKFRAEVALREIADQGALPFTIIRAPLVYGPDVKANFLRLMRAVDRRLPLPFGLIRNRRSLCYVRNLTDALIWASESPSSGGRTYLVSDGEAVSTPGLVDRIAASLRTVPRLIPVPVVILHMAGIVSRRHTAVQRLTGSLVVDMKGIMEDGWSPRYSMHQGLDATAEWYRSLDHRMPG